MANFPTSNGVIITNDGSAPAAGITYLYGDALTVGSLRFRIQVPEAIQYLERLEFDPNNPSELIWVVKTTVENSLTTDQFYIDVAGGGVQFLTKNPAILNKQYSLIRSSFYNNIEVTTGDYRGRTTLVTGLRLPLEVERPKQEPYLSPPFADGGEFFTTDDWGITFTQQTGVIFYNNTFTFSGVPANTYMRYSRSAVEGGLAFAENVSEFEWDRDKTTGQLITNGDNTVEFPVPLGGEVGRDGFIRLQFSNSVTIEGLYGIPPGTSPSNPHDGGLFFARAVSLIADYDRREASTKTLYTDELVGTTIKVGTKFSAFEGIVCVREHVGTFPIDIFSGDFARIGDSTKLVFSGTALEKESRLVTSWLDGDTLQVVTTLPTNVAATYDVAWGDNGNGQGVVTVIDAERATSFSATSTGAVLTHKAVYITGNDPILDIPAITESDIAAPFSLPVVGITRDAVNTGTVGTVVTNGNIEGFDTSSWSVGDQLYIDTFGDLTNVKPPTHNQVLAQVVKVGVSDGIIKVGIKATVAPSATKVLNAASFTNQIPVGVDTPLQVEFGAAQGSASDPVELSAAGAITINETAMYELMICLSLHRTNAIGVAEIYARMLVNGSQSGVAISFLASDDDMTIPIQFSTFQDLTATDVVTVEFYRDSSGANNGQLSTNTSSIGWGNSPSAMISVLKF